MQAAVKFDLPLEFCEKLYAKITDKSYYDRAVKMFVDGRLKYSDAVSDDSLDIEAIRHDVAKNLVALRKERHAAVALRKRVSDYYGKECLRYAIDGNAALNVVYVDKNTRTISAIIGFSKTTRQAAVFYANNQYEKRGIENLHSILVDFRHRNKAFVRQLKHFCTGEPATTFKFDERTIRKAQ